jgi:hypothetical protein
LFKIFSQQRANGMAVGGREFDTAGDDDDVVRWKGL